MIAPAQARVKPHDPVACLAPQTWSVLDFVRTDLRTLRLAIAFGDRSDRALHPRKSQDAATRLLVRGRSGLGWSNLSPLHQRLSIGGEMRVNERAWMDH
jgi:hypothetical protein